MNTAEMEVYGSLEDLCDIELDDSLLMLDDVAAPIQRPTLELVFSREKHVKTKIEQLDLYDTYCSTDSMALDEAEACSRKKNKRDKPPYVPWNEVEDEKLKNIVGRMISETKSPGNPHPDNTNTFPWGSISLRMTGRTPKQCRERWRNKLNPNIKQCPWSIEEDITLMDMHKKLGNRWVLLASLLPGRTENSVKTRFKSIIRAKRRSWRQEEDNQVLKLFNQLGGKWTEIAAKLPRRTANGVKVRLRHLTNCSVEDKAEAGSPSQSFGIEMPQISRKNDAFLKEFGSKEMTSSYRRTNRKRQRQRQRKSEDEDDVDVDTESTQAQPLSPKEYNFIDTIHPSNTTEKETSNKKSKGTRALLMDKLQSPDDFGATFASTIATILKPTGTNCKSQGFEPFESEANGIMAELCG